MLKGVISVPRSTEAVRRPNLCFPFADEDLIRQILTDGAGSLPHPQDGGQNPWVETDLISGL